MYLSPWEDVLEYQIVGDGLIVCLHRSFKIAVTHFGDGFCFCQICSTIQVENESFQ
jgi:hypothetical protein